MGLVEGLETVMAMDPIVGDPMAMEPMAMDPMVGDQMVGGPMAVVVDTRRRSVLAIDI